MVEFNLKVLRETQYVLFTLNSIITFWMKQKVQSEQIEPVYVIRASSKMLFG